MKKVGIITNASATSGVGSRAYEIAKRVQGQDEFAVSLTNLAELPVRKLPGFLGSKSISWIRVARAIPKFDIYDLSNQTLSFIAKKRQPSIVTIHDLIELTDPQDLRASLVNRYLLSGVMHADRIIAVSKYTKQIVVEQYGISAARIAVIPNGVHELYAPIEHFRETIAYKQLVQDYGIKNRTPLIMHVGSEHPRKNLETVLQTIAILKKQYPDILLLKIGEPGLRSGRANTLHLIDQLNLRNNVKFLGNIPLDRINELYNIADALLFPSKLEGFGLPPLEAMAAGCPVVCSNATSLPEVVGDGAIMCDAMDAKAFAGSIVHLMANMDFRSHLIELGRARAAQFSWDTAARDMLEIYKTL